MRALHQRHTTDLFADAHATYMSILIGVGANKRIVSGQPVKIADLLAE